MRNNVYLQAFLVWGAAIGLMLSGILAMGCSSPAPAAVKSHKALAAAIIATEAGTAPAPKPSPAPSGKCEECNGTGKLGDGTVFVTCQACGGDGVKDSASCSCGAACECAALKAKLAEAERENEVNKAVALRLEEKAAFLDNEIGNLYRPGDKVEHPNGHYELKWVWVPRPVQQSAIKPKRVQAPDPYMSPCGPGGCPTPSARGFRLFGR